MNIKSKYNIGDIVKYQFEKCKDEENNHSCLCIEQVMTETCYAGTQVFYLARPVGLRLEDNSYVIYHGTSKNNQTGWTKYREDELVEVEQSISDMIQFGDSKNTNQ